MLPEFHLLNNYLLHTDSGQDNIAQDGLRREIELENRQLGWLALVKLSSMVGVELIHCEGQALKILQDDLLLSSTLGEFVASSYRDSIAEESISPRWILATIQLESLLEGQQLDAELSWGDIKVCLLLYSNRLLTAFWEVGSWRYFDDDGGQLFGSHHLFVKALELIEGVDVDAWW